MSKVYVIGIGFRPLDKRASGTVLSSDVVLVNDRLLEVFRNYAEYEGVKDRTIDRWARKGWLTVHRDHPTARPRFRPVDVMAMAHKAPERKLRRKLR